jgi:ribosomal protein S18 acetylase RimI-like enzyme
MPSSTRHFSVRALGAADAAAYNAFLLQGVREHPDTLRISEADIAAAPFSTEHREGATFVAHDADGTWLGVVTVEREQGRSKRRHVGWILRMYVSAENAGAGVGRALLRHAVGHARELPGVEKLNLTVAAHNQRAVALYESEGFQRIGHEDDAFRDPTPRTELTMSRRW